jgi:hypothetical protein
VHLLTQEYGQGHVPTRSRPVAILALGDLPPHWSMRTCERASSAHSESAFSILPSARFKRHRDRCDRDPSLGDPCAACGTTTSSPAIRAQSADSVDRSSSPESREPYWVGTSRTGTPTQAPRNKHGASPHSRDWNTCWNRMCPPSEFSAMATLRRVWSGPNAGGKGGYARDPRLRFKSEAPANAGEEHQRPRAPQVIACVVSDYGCRELPSGRSPPGRGRCCADRDPPRHHPADHPWRNRAPPRARSRITSSRDWYSPGAAT